MRFSLLKNISCNNPQKSHTEKKGAMYTVWGSPEQGALPKGYIKSLAEFSRASSMPTVKLDLTLHLSTIFPASYSESGLPGTLAVQMPCNFNEPSHRLRRELGAQWKTRLDGVDVPPRAGGEPEGSEDGDGEDRRPACVHQVLLRGLLGAGPIRPARTG